MSMFSSIEHDFYTSAEYQGKYELFEVGDLVLDEDGETLQRCKLAYRTFGQLNKAKDNAILITTGFSETGKGAEDLYIGSDHALNPEEYFIIIIDQIGSGTSSSPQNMPPPQSKANFPKVRIADDVRAQHKLITELFNISELALVVGGSMGGQQVYEWAVRYPDMLKRAAPIAATAKTSMHQIIFTDTLQEALTSDPAWKDGWYDKGTDVRKGMARMAKILANHSFSPEFYQEERWRSVLKMTSLTDFIKRTMMAYFEPMDPNALLCQMWKWQRADVSRHADGSLATALNKIRAKTFVIAISHDMFFPVSECRADQELIPDSELKIVESKDGHSALGGVETEYMDQVDTFLNELLAS